MEQFKDYFKSREEVEKYFGNEVFKFKHMSDNMMTFVALQPRFIDEELFVFSLTFYYEDGDFFDYSSFDNWFDKFQLSEVACISEETHKITSMFFRKYKDQENGKRNKV